MSEKIDQPAQASQQFPFLPPLRSLNLSDERAREASAPAREAPRVVVQGDALTTVLSGGRAAWATIRGELWEKALRNAGLEEAWQATGRPATRSSMPEPIQALDRLYQQVDLVRTMERRLGQSLEDDGHRTIKEVDHLVVAMSVAGVIGALLPGVLRAMALGFLLFFGGRSGWRLWGPRPTVTLETLAEARAELGWRVSQFVSHTWVCAAGDKVLECAPHGEYLRRRIADLDASRGVSEAQMRDVDALVRDVRSANARLGLAEEDAETRRLLATRADSESRVAQIERLRELVVARLNAYQAQVDRLGAIASRRALSEKVASLVDNSARDTTDQDIAEVEVDVADLESRLRTLAVDASDANASLLGVLEAGGAIGRRRAA